MDDNASQFDVAAVTNISTYDFPRIETNIDRVRASRTTLEMGGKRRYEAPSVPVLMWDGRCYELRAGETKQYPRFLAEHFAEKIIDRVLISTEKQDDLRAPKTREILRKQVFGEAKVSTPVQPETQSESGLETKTIGDLRKIAKESGVATLRTDNREALISKINESNPDFGSTDSES